MRKEITRYNSEKSSIGYGAGASFNEGVMGSPNLDNEFVNPNPQGEYTGP